MNAIVLNILQISIYVKPRLIKVHFCLSILDDFLPLAFKCICECRQNNAVNGIQTSSSLHDVLLSVEPGHSTRVWTVAKAWTGKVGTSKPVTFCYCV